MVRTIVIRVDARAAGLEQAGDLPVHLVDDRLGEEPARDARLVGDHDDAQAGAVERADRVDAPGIELDTLGPIEVADLLDERAVAIEKDGGRSSRGSSGLRDAATRPRPSTPRMQR